jgi:hypothetical protein
MQMLMPFKFISVVGTGSPFKEPPIDLAGRWGPWRYLGSGLPVAGQAAGGPGQAAGRRALALHATPRLGQGCQGTAERYRS